MRDPVKLQILAGQCENDATDERLIDCDIAEELLGGTIEWKTTNYTMESYPMRKYESADHVKGYGFEPVPLFTTSIDAAYSLIPRNGYGGLDAVWRMYLTNVGYTNGVWLDGKAKAVVYHPFSSGPESYVGIASTMARALAAAALRAQADAVYSENYQHPSGDTLITPEETPPEPKADQPS